MCVYMIPNISRTIQHTEMKKDQRYLNGDRKDLSPQKFDKASHKLFLVKFVLKSDVLRLDSRSGSAFLT